MSRVLSLPQLHRAIAGPRDGRAVSRGGLARAVTVALLAAAAVAIPSAAEAQSIATWQVATGTWTTGAVWANGIQPSSGTSAYFGSNGGLITGNINIMRSGAATGVLGMTFDYANGDTFLGGTDNNSQLNIGADGITLTGSSGNVTISGTTTIGTGRLNLLLNASQTWTNNSSSGIEDQRK
jgi:hypothetical protein